MKGTRFSVLIFDLEVIQKLCFDLLFIILFCHWKSKMKFKRTEEERKTKLIKNSSL